MQILYRSKSPRPKSSLKNAAVLLWRILQIPQWQHRCTEVVKPRSYIHIYIPMCGCFLLKTALLELSRTYYPHSFASTNTLMEATNTRCSVFRLILPLEMSPAKVPSTIYPFAPISNKPRSFGFPADLHIGVWIAYMYSCDHDYMLDVGLSRRSDPQDAHLIP